MIKKSFAIVLLCLAVGLGSADAATDLSVTVLPEQISIGAAYNGARLSVAGEIPSDASALVRITGEQEHYTLKQKGRALGVLWMNLDSVTISNLPSVFILYLPREAVAGNNARPAWQTLGLGLEGLRKQADIVARDDDKVGLFDEFVKLKKKAGLYGVVVDAVRYGAAAGPVKSFEAVLRLPAALPQGRYQIQVFAVTNGVVEATAERTIDAVEVGMPAWISAMAFNHGAIYGVLAVLVAIVAGLLTGILFKGEKGAH